MSDTKLLSIYDLQTVATEESNDLAIAKVAVLSTAPNSHKIKITEEILRRDVPSILGKFVVADYSKWKGDVTTHTPNEVVVGYIPPNQEVQFVPNDEGYIVAYVDAVISKIYATDVYNLFVDNNFRNASVEMGTSGDKQLDDGTIIIDGLEIYGITILGTTVLGSCPDANIQIVRFSETDAEDYYTKEKALKLSEELRKFAESLDSKDNKETKENKMADKKLLAEEEEKDVIMSDANAEEEKNLADPKSEEEESKDEEKEMAEQPTEMSEDENKEVEDDEKKDVEDEDEADDNVKEDEKDMSCGDDKEMGCGDKEFSMAEFASKELIDSIEDEKVKEFVGMSADDMIKAFAEIVKENAELNAYKEGVLMAERDEKIKLVLASVKLDIEEEAYKKFAKEAENVTLDGVDAFANKVKAFAYEHAKKETQPKDDEIFVFGGVNNVQIEDEDVFSRIEKM